MHIAVGSAVSSIHCLKLGLAVIRRNHGEEFETGMRIDERHLENFGVLFFREFK